MNEDFNKINQLIAQSKNILITAHRFPDGDAVGSALALKFALRKQGMEASIFIDSYSQKEYKFLPGYNLIDSKLDNYDFDLVIALDYSDFKRLSINNLLEQRNPTVITFDHHLGKGQNHIGEVKILDQASSTAELIYCFLKESNWPMDENVVTCLLAGIVSDTGGFLHANTSNKTMLIMGELSSQGVKVDKIINQILNRSNSVENDSQSLIRAISRIEKYPKLDLAYLIIDNDEFKKWNKFDQENLILTVGSIGDCRWASLLVEYERGETRVSLRSEEYKGVDVSEIASLFGGGGHKLASAFRINKRPKKAFKSIIKKSKKVLV